MPDMRSDNQVGHEKLLRGRSRFSLPELKVLIDAVEASFISKKGSDELVEKIARSA